MNVLFNIVSITLLLLFIPMTWLGSRHLGVVGTFCVHLLVVLGYFCIAMMAMMVGRYEYDGILSIIGLSIQAFLLNCLLSPVALVALWRRWKAVRTLLP